jgi:acyl-CoA synthetase (NDP forming)
MTAPVFADLSLLVNPNSVVLVGASDRKDSIGGRALSNLVDESDYKGTLYLTNPSKDDINGRLCYRSVLDLPEAPDVAVVAVPASAVMQVLEQCAEKGIRFVILFTSGFGETGDEGKRLEAQMKEIVRRSGMRIYGPNCPGLSNINKRLGFTFSPAFKLDLQSGPVGIATQGGGLGRTFLQAMDRGIGAGLWSSAGNEVDLEISDFIYYMAEAPDIKVIVTLIEGFKDGKKFVAAVQHAARKGKPVVALKIGKSDYGIKAAQSHTAAIAGSADVNSAVFRQLGIIEVDDVDELVDTAWLLARALPKGNDQVAVYCSSGGTAALAADMIGASGLTLTTFQPQTTEFLARSLPSFAAIGNPVDTTTEILTNPGVVDSTLKAIADDVGTSLILYPSPLEYGTVSLQGAESAIRVQASTDVPILPVWMSDRQGAGYKAFVAAGLTPARSVGKAVKAVRRWVTYGNWLKAYDPAYIPLMMRADIESGETPAVQCRTMAESEAKAWLAKYDIPLLASGIAASREDARRIADSIGYPVVAKVASADITHKSDVGGVIIGLANGDAVVEGWDKIHAAVKQAKPDANIDGLLIECMAPGGGVEILIGVHRDPTFGHMLTFGLGGIYVEIFKDVTRRMLPLTPNDAEALVREIQSFPLLDGARGKPRADIPALVQLLLRISDFVVANAARIEELDINPVWVGALGQGALPLDAVIVLRS